MTIICRIVIDFDLFAFLNILTRSEMKLFQGGLFGMIGHVMHPIITKLSTFFKLRVALLKILY
jgi:hypothetical protein